MNKFAGLITLLMLAMLAACGPNPQPTIPPGPFTPVPGTTTVPGTNATVAPTSAPTAAGVPPTGTPLPAQTAAPANTSAATAAPTVKPTTPPAPTATAKSGLDMHTVDWFKVVTTDPNLTYDSTVPASPGSDNAPYVKLKGSQNTQGYALISAGRILFLDISGDGQEEAIISLYSGGTAGNLGLLVYTVANNAPILADSLGGYKIGGTADGNRLKVTEPIYQGWEPNCCPSGFVETRYQLLANKLSQVSRDEVPVPGARLMTVQHYYDLLLAQKYSDAYNNFLSASYRAAHPYKAWLDGYNSTVSFTATASENRDNTIKVDLVSQERVGKFTATHHSVWTWKLVWVSTAKFKQWVLDSATVTEVK